VQRNKNSSAPDRKMQSQLRKNVVDAVKQAVEKLLKAELLQNEQDHESTSQAGGDDEDAAMADKIQAEVVGSDTKADGHALAGGNMDEGDNIVPPEADDDDDGDGDADEGGLEEDEDMKGVAAEDQQQDRDDDAEDAAANKSKEKKQKTATKPGDGEAQDAAAAVGDGDDDDNTAANAGVIIGTNDHMEDEDDQIVAFNADNKPLQVTKRSESNLRGEDDVLKAWQGHSMEAAVASRELCEALRLILEPTLASKMHGDFKTGKRINMRKVVTPHPFSSSFVYFLHLRSYPTSPAASAAIASGSVVRRLRSVRTRLSCAWTTATACLKEGPCSLPSTHSP
jgi:midasin